MYNNNNHKTITSNSRWKHDSDHNLFAVELPFHIGTHWRIYKIAEPLWLTCGSKPVASAPSQQNFDQEKPNFWDRKRREKEENELWVDNNKCKNKFIATCHGKGHFSVRKICSIKQTRPDRMTSFLIEDDWGRLSGWHGLMRGKGSTGLLGG